MKGVVTINLSQPRLELGLSLGQIRWTNVGAPQLCLAYSIVNNTELENQDLLNGFQFPEQMIHFY